MAKIYKRATNPELWDVLVQLERKVVVRWAAEEHRPRWVWAYANMRTSDFPPGRAPQHGDIPEDYAQRILDNPALMP